MLYCAGFPPAGGRQFILGSSRASSRKRSWNNASTTTGVSIWSLRISLGNTVVFCFPMSVWNNKCFSILNHIHYVLIYFLSSQMWCSFSVNKFKEKKNHGSTLKKNIMHIRCIDYTEKGKKNNKTQLIPHKYR